MTPKEKAEELVERYEVLTTGWNYIEDAKKCALICVDEILDNFFDGSLKIKDGKKVFQGVWSTSHHAMEYYNEVKQEINKL